LRSISFELSGETGDVADRAHDAGILKSVDDLGKQRIVRVNGIPHTSTAPMCASIPGGLPAGKPRKWRGGAPRAAPSSRMKVATRPDCPNSAGARTPIPQKEPRNPAGLPDLGGRAHPLPAKPLHDQIRNLDS